MEVFAVGRGRTGTISLKQALNILGYKAFHFKDLFHSYSGRSLFRKWNREIFSKRPVGLYHLDTTDLTDRGFNAAADVSAYWEQFMEEYPDAKFILTTRTSPEDYKRSMTKLIDLNLWFLRWVPWFPLAREWNSFLRWACVLNFGEEKCFAPNNTHAFPLDDLIDDYLAHNEKIRQAFADQPGRLLEYRVTEGWEPLCRFLGKDIPDVPFPHANAANALERLVQVTAFALNAVLAMLIMGVVYFFVRRIRRSLKSTSKAKVL